MWLWAALFGVFLVMGGLAFLWVGSQLLERVADWGVEVYEAPTPARFSPERYRHSQDRARALRDTVAHDLGGPLVTICSGSTVMGLADCE